MIKSVSPGSLCGTLAVMPSKSASHRAVMMAAMAAGTTRIEPLQLSKDVEATLRCAQTLGLIDAPEITPHATPGFVRVCMHGGGSVMGGSSMRSTCAPSAFLYTHRIKHFGINLSSSQNTSPRLIFRAGALHSLFYARSSVTRLSMSMISMLCGQLVMHAPHSRQCEGSLPSSVRRA